MKTQGSDAAKKRPGPWLWILAVLVFLGPVAALPTRAAEAPAAAISSPAAAIVPGAVPRGEALASLQMLLGNRKTMLQIATIGMFLGLFIMMRK